MWRIYCVLPFLSQYHQGHLRTYLETTAEINLRTLSDVHILESIQHIFSKDDDYLIPVLDYQKNMNEFVALIKTANKIVCEIKKLDFVLKNLSMARRIAKLLQSTYDETVVRMVAYWIGHINVEGVQGKVESYWVETPNREPHGPAHQTGMLGL